MKLKPWQDWAILGAAAWLYLSPFAFDNASLSDPSAAVSWACAVVLMVSVSEALAFPDPVEEWVDLIVGIVLIVSPWLLDFSDDRLPAVNSVLVGMAVTLCAISALGRDGMTTLRRPWR